MRLLQGLGFGDDLVARFQDMPECVRHCSSVFVSVRVLSYMLQIGQHLVKHLQLLPVEVSGAVRDGAFVREDYRREVAIYDAQTWKFGDY